MSNPRPLLLFPCNGNALESLDCLGSAWDCIGFVDDSPEKQETIVHGVRVHGRGAFTRWPTAFVLAVPGGPASFRRRQGLIESLGLPAHRYARVVHPQASVSRRAEVGTNTLIMAGVVLAGNVIVGQHCCVLPNTVVHHDAEIGDWTLVGANVTVAGGTVVGRNCYLGSACSVMNDLQVGDGALVGFGANVIRNVAAGSRVVGNPARAL